jgi:cobalt/nickel transport system permease protein
MHLSDTLISPAVAIGSGVISFSLIAIAISKAKREHSTATAPLAGVMGAFIFAAQMINFSIPGTGASGHIIGGILLASVLGPWSGFITLSAVIAVQCLLFADGGLMALGCNILNMAVCSTLIVYPLLFHPFLRGEASKVRICVVALMACIVSVEIGAFLVAVETHLSGISTLPFSQFAALMLGIHLIIGIGEGIATSAVICYINRFNPNLLQFNRQGICVKPKHIKRTILAIAVITVIIAAAFSILASSYPDGLEWAISKLSNSDELAEVKNNIALIPNYESAWSGIIGSCIVVGIVWCISTVISFTKQK